MTLQGQEGFGVAKYCNGDEYTPHCDGDCTGAEYIPGGRVASMVSGPGLAGQGAGNVSGSLFAICSSGGEDGV